MITYVGNPKLEDLAYHIPVLGQKMFVAGSMDHRRIAIHYFGTSQMETVAPVFFGTLLVADRPTWTQAEYLKNMFLKPEDFFMYPFYDNIRYRKPVHVGPASDSDRVSFLVFGAAHQLEGLHHLAHSIIIDPDDAEQKSIALCDLIAESVTVTNMRFADSFEKLKSIQKQDHIRAEVAKAKVAAKT
jgi:hypothetical protein